MYQKRINGGFWESLRLSSDLKLEKTFIVLEYINSTLWHFWCFQTKCVPASLRLPRMTVMAKTVKYSFKTKDKTQFLSVSLGNSSSFYFKPEWDSKFLLTWKIGKQTQCVCVCVCCMTEAEYSLRKLWYVQILWEVTGFVIHSTPGCCSG